MNVYTNGYALKIDVVHWPIINYEVNIILWFTILT